MINKTIFRENDIRGKLNNGEITEENIILIIKAYAIFLKNRNIQKVIVGNDGRSSLIKFQNNVVNELSSQGIHVFDIGLALTPIIYFAQYHFQSEGAISITASHNPSGWCGLKLSKGYSTTFAPEDMEELQSYLVNESEQSNDISPSLIKNINIRNIYIDEVLKHFPDRNIFKNKKVVLEFGNGIAGLYAVEIFQKLGCIVYSLNCNPDIDNADCFPDPSKSESRKQLVQMVTHPYINANIGFCYDCDGDRLGVVDNSGRNLFGDQITLLFSYLMNKNGFSPKVIVDTKITPNIINEIKKYSCNVIQVNTGHSYIKKKLIETNSDIAGEKSGHVYIKEFYGYDDAIIASIKLLQYIGENKLSEILEQVEVGNSIELRVPYSKNYLEVEHQIDRLMREIGYKQISERTYMLNNDCIVIRPSSNINEVSININTCEKTSFKNLIEILRKELKI